MKALAARRSLANNPSLNSIFSLFRVSHSHRRVSANRCEASFYKVDSLPIKETMTPPEDYSSWTNEQLIERVSELERQLREQNERKQQHPLQKSSTALTTTAADCTRDDRQFDSTKYNTRYVALKIAYLGQRYNGFEHHTNNTTSLPTIEEEMWKALSKTKLIFPDTPAPMDWRGCGYTKCGRTDKGVSAFGQVIALHVRSARPKLPDSQDASRATQFDPVNDELPYPKILNRVLPEDIRVLAWCPQLSPGFSARFSCRERRYRYFFTQPAYLPIGRHCGLERRRNGDIQRDGWLDISAMQKASQYFVGSHDFRNFCKIDPTRQITNFERTIFRSTIEEWGSLTSLPSFLGHPSFFPHGQGTINNEPKVYSFTVHGSAFLWHQIRHMIAILFLVGQGLEDPSIVLELLDAQCNPCKPLYDMADDAPLVLWDCIFSSESDDQGEDALEWVYADGKMRSAYPSTESVRGGDGRYGVGGINEVLWTNWRRTKVNELLAGSLLDLVASQAFVPEVDPNRLCDHDSIVESPRSTKVFDGGNHARLKGEYIPILNRERMEPINTLNARFLERKIAKGANTASGTN